MEEKEICTWDVYTDDRFHVAENEEDDSWSSLERIKSSCRGLFWLPDIEQDQLSGVVSKLDFKFCPFCGREKKDVLWVDL